jgi:simple sugar transport system permease protein
MSSQVGASEASAPQVRSSTRARWLALTYRYGLLVLLVGLTLFFALTLEAFPTWENLLVILQSVAITAIVALGLTVSLAINGFDLSVGSNVGLVVMATATAMVVFGLPGIVAAVIGLAIGVGIGLLNSALIVRARIPDLLATLGTLFLIQGLSLIITGGQSISAGMTVGGQVTTGAFDDVFLWLGRGEISEVPIPVIIMLIVSAIMIVFLGRTRWGRILYAIGGNREAAPTSSPACSRRSAASCSRVGWDEAMSGPAPPCCCSRCRLPSSGTPCWAPTSQTPSARSSGRCSSASSSVGSRCTTSRTTRRTS